MLARAIIRDLYARTKAAQMLSTLTIIMAIAPIVGPLLGGQIIRISTWHSIFWLLAVIGALMFFSIFLLPETHPAEKRAKTSVFGAFGSYRQLLSNRQFMRYTLCIAFFYVSAYAFIAGSPFVYITYYGVGTQYYGGLFAVNLLGVIGLSFVNRTLVKKVDLDTLLRIATVIAMMAMIVLALLVWFKIGGIYSIVITVFIFFSMNAMIAASATAAALDGVPELAGSASALIGSLQYGSGIISSILLARLSDGTPWTMAWIMAVFTIASAAMALTSAGKGKR